MALIVNQEHVTGKPVGRAAQRQALLNEERVPGTAILLDRLSLSTGGQLQLSVPKTSVAFLQPLEGQASLTHAGENVILGTSHVACLPPGFSGTLNSADAAVFLYGEIPQADRFDANFAKEPPKFRVSDWTREPVLDSEHDARKRIYLITPNLFSTKAVKGEIIIYPPGTAASNHHHEGAEHFMYVLRGRGTVYANEQPFAVRKGDLIYYPDRERHYLEAGNEELVFAEYFAPAEFRTLWVDESQICTWHPTGRDIEGRVPVREINSHSSAEIVNPADV